MTDPNTTPTPAETLAACRTHGTTAKGWRVLAAALDATHPDEAAACRVTADQLDAAGELWGTPAQAALLTELRGTTADDVHAMCDAYFEAPTVRIPAQTLAEVKAEWDAKRIAADSGDGALELHERTLP